MLKKNSRNTNYKIPAFTHLPREQQIVITKLLNKIRSMPEICGIKQERIGMDNYKMINPKIIFKKMDKSGKMFLMFFFFFFFTALLLFIIVIIIFFFAIVLNLVFGLFRRRRIGQKRI